MEKEWERADVDATADNGEVTLTTSNITGLQLDLANLSQAVKGIKQVKVDGTTLPLPEGLGTAQVPLVKSGKTWRIDVAGAAANAPGKRPGRCGPIDHAFMSSFVHVKPTGTPLNEAAGAWVKSEMEHALVQWRQVFRGDAPVKDDGALTEDDIKNSNLILWGDPSSNAVLKKIAAKLPLKWTKDSLEFRGYKLDANYAPILIFPNPLNPAKYVVLNSGHTFRERAAINNSDQTPKLPDWAIVDLRTPPDDLWPGLIYDAGFFDEQWR